MAIQPAHRQPILTNSGIHVLTTRTTTVIQSALHPAIPIRSATPIRSRTATTRILKFGHGNYEKDFIRYSLCADGIRRTGTGTSEP